MPFVLPRQVGLVDSKEDFGIVRNHSKSPRNFWAALLAKIILFCISFATFMKAFLFAGIIGDRLTTSDPRRLFYFPNSWESSHHRIVASKEDDPRFPQSRQFTSLMSPFTTILVFVSVFTLAVAIA